MKTIYQFGDNYGATLYDDTYNLNKYNEKENSNIIFGGCSYTWGQSLWYHGDFTNDNHPRDGIFYENMVCPECKDYMIKNRFATQVGNYFNKETIVKAKNGGSNMEILEFCKKSVNSNTELIIIQTTHFSRDINIEINQQIINFENFVLEMENKNIPVRFIHWMFIDVNSDEYELTKNDKWFGVHFKENKLHSDIIRNRTILLDGDFNFWKWTDLKYSLKHYSTEKYGEIKKRTIVGFFGHAKTTKYKDVHFSIHGHNIVAKSIINYIKEKKLL